jgi:O-antigen ligase
MIRSRFSEKIYYPILIASVCSVLISLFLLELFFVLLTILWLCEKFEDKKKSFDIFHAAVLMFGFFRILSIFFSQYPSVSYQSFYKNALFYLSFFSMSYYFKVIGYKKIKMVLQYFFLAAIFTAVVGIIKFDLSLADRASSFSSGYSTYSSYLLVAFSIFIFIPVSTVGKYKTLIKITGLSLMLTGIIVSLGRMNIFIAVLVLGFSFLLRKIDWKIAGVVVLLTILFSVGSFQLNFAGVDKRIEQPATLSDRDVIMHGAEDIFLKFEKPILGYGPRTFHQVFPYENQLADKGVGSWHNDFIQMYFESGFLGLVSFLALLFIVLYYSYKLFRSQQNPDMKNLIWAILIGTVALILSSLTAGFIDSPVLSVLFALLVALVSGIKYVFIEEKTHPESVQY